MKATIQEEETGCGIAAVATILQLPYSIVQAQANALGIYATDEKLFSDTQYMRRLLTHYTISTADTEKPFQSWEDLPDLALLSIKHHYENGTPFWHWVVFHRGDCGARVLDSAPHLESNERSDLEAIDPKWYIEVSP